jgi:hypothetical protein
LTKLALMLALGALFACGDLVRNPCQDYVDYVCECHGADPNLDCETLKAANSNAGPDQYLDCEIEHQALLELDAQMGHTCGGDTASEGSDSGA